MSEEEKGGGPAEPAPLTEIVDKPKLAETPAVVDRPERPPPERKPKADKPAVPEGYVPLREVLDERERRQKIEAERDRYQRAWEDHQRKLAAEQDKDPAPDMFRDPNAYNEWVDRQLNKRAEAIARQHVEPLIGQVTQAQLALSELRIEKQIGPDRYQKLNDWITAQGEQFRAWCLGQSDPYAAAYQQWRQRTTFERLGEDDLDTYEQKLREKIMAELKGPVDPPDAEFDDDRPPPKQTQAPRSFAAARSADPNRDASTGRFTGPRPLGEILREQPKTRKR
jgi:hypothetical protein